MVRSQPNENILELSPTKFARRRPGQLPEIVDLTALAGNGSTPHWSREAKEQLYDRAMNTEFQDRKLSLGQRILGKLLLLLVAWHNTAEDPRHEIETERFGDCSRVAAELARVINAGDTEATLWLVESILPFLKKLVTEALDQAGTDTTTEN